MSVRTYLQRAGYIGGWELFVIIDTPGQPSRYLSTPTKGAMTLNTIEPEGGRIEPLLTLTMKDADEIMRSLAEAMVEKGLMPKPTPENVEALKAHIDSLEQELTRLHTVLGMVIGRIPLAPFVVQTSAQP